MPSDLTAIRSEAAPAPVGPYSQAVRNAGLIFASGQVPLDPETGKIVGTEIEDQTLQVISNLKAVLESADSGLDCVLRTTVYLIDLENFSRMNAVYAEHFRGDPPPARSTVQVAGLPLGAQIEIDLIAVPRR